MKQATAISHHVVCIFWVQDKMLLDKTLPHKMPRTKCSRRKFKKKKTLHCWWHFVQWHFVRTPHLLPMCCSGKCRDNSTRISINQSKSIKIFISWCGI